MLLQPAQQLNDRNRASAKILFSEERIMTLISNGRTGATLTLIAACMALAACAKDSGSKGTDSNGNCTSATISAYNDIQHKARMYDLTKDSSYLTGVKNSCSQYKSLIGGDTCKAEDLRTRATTYVSSSSVDTVCNKADQILNPKPVDASKTSTTTTTTTTTSASVPAPRAITEVDNRKVGDLANGIEIEVKDEAVINELLRAGASYIIQDGRVIRGTYLVERSKNLCYLERNDSTLVVKNGDVLRMTYPRSRGEKLAILSFDAKTEMGCLKTNSYSEWTVQQVREVFATAANVKAAE
jgi:hypothetical protein